MPFTMPEKSYLVALGLDAVVTLFIYKLYKRNNKASNEVKTAINTDISPDLIQILEDGDGSSIPYACIEGVTTAVGKTLKSEFVDDQEGVIHQLRMVEHKSKRSQGYWADVKNILRDTVETVAFALCNPAKPENKIYVDDVKEADYILDELTVTHDKYQSNRSGLLQRGVDRLFGEVSKGIQETEQMLLVGTPLLGFGELMLVGGKVHLIPPINGQKYILTRMSRTEILKKMESKSHYLKVLGLISAFIAGGLLAVVLMKYLKKYMEYRRYQKLLEEMRAARTQLQNRIDNNGDSNSCVICMENPREVVLLDCGHICLCADCANILPQQLCPVCRASISRVMPLYMP